MNPGRQTFAEMAQDHPEIGTGVEQPGEDQPEEMRASIHREAPGRGGQFDIALKVGLEHVGMRNRRMQVNRHVQRLGTLEDYPIPPVVEELAANVTVDQGAFEAELRNRSFQFFHRNGGVSRAQWRESSQATGGRVYSLAH